MTTLDTGVGATRTAIPGGLVAAVGGPLALAISNACFAYLTRDGHAEDTGAYLDLVGAHQGLVEVGAAFGLLACLLLVPAIWAVAARLRDRVPRLASTGAWLMASGYVLAVALSVETLIALSVARSGTSSGGFAAAVDQHTSAVGTAMYVVFGVGALLGGLVLGVAMIRHDSVPLWCGAALIASEPVRVVGLVSGFDLLTAVASLLILAAFLGTLRRT